MINKCVDNFLDKLEPFADGRAQIPLRDEFALLTLNVISKVS